VREDKQNLVDLLVKGRQPQWEDDEKQLEFRTDHKDVLQGLNEEQATAVVRAHCCKDFQMILGVPASGKHEVLIRFILIGAKLGKKMLLVSHSSMTLDNVLSKLISNEDEA